MGSTSLNSQSPWIVKIGGSIAEEGPVLNGILIALAELKKAGFPIILVHGGGKDINRHLAWLNEEPKFIGGLRVTSESALKIVEMTLSAYVNKKLVGILNQFASQAVGISGVDGPTLICEALSPELGQVGSVKEVRLELLKVLLSAGFLPVLSPISVDFQQTHFNVNADDAASAVAQAMQAAKLIFISDVQGVLDAQKKVIPELSAPKIEAMIAEGIVAGGMIPKLRSCAEALKQGVQQVHICGWTSQQAFMSHMHEIENHGTIIRG